ncbi:MAG TPA: AraC family transcriptional regulator [Burkholderiaceae bacterium]
MLAIQMPVRARALEGFCETVRAHGGDPFGLLAKAGIARKVLSDPDSTFPMDRLASVMELAGQELGLADFGLQMAEHQDISVLGSVALIAQHSATFRDALIGVARYVPYHTPAARLELLVDEQAGVCELCYDLSFSPGTPSRMAMELCYSIAYRFMRLVVSEDVRGWHINFSHAKGLDAAGYRRYFKCPVRLGQPRNLLRFPAALLDVPIDPANARLRGETERMLSNLMHRFPLDIGRQVQDLVRQQLATGGSSITRIASQLGMHTRTLQRRLGEQGLFFEDIVDDVRRSRAQEYLRYGAMPLSQLTGLLGYSDQSSLNRSCVRWFGRTPAQLRGG